jgi:hypothetical protein
MSIDWFLMKRMHCGSFNSSYAALKIGGFTNNDYFKCVSNMLNDEAEDVEDLLLKAISCSDYEIFEIILLKYPYSISQKTLNKELYNSLYREQIFIKRLLELGANPTPENGDIPASYKRCIEINNVEALISLQQYGLNLKRDSYGTLYYCAIHGTALMFKHILKNTGCTNDQLKWIKGIHKDIKNICDNSIIINCYNQLIRTL